VSEHSNTKLILNLTEAAELLGIKPSQLYEHKERAPVLVNAFRYRTCA
jgi:hypothetical protein